MIEVANLDAQEIAKDVMENIYTPKQSCPRDLGFYYCDECIEEALEISIATDYPADPVGCDKIENSKVCGYSHLGYSWCKECEEANRKTHSHIGEFEVVATIGEME